ncbi:phosphatase [Thiospirochaeta perfilievii]|uniref:Phosphatase n=1 Tax=Thiospirochaeta perfilievii TaxID=252967 RepID=A0A5C1Q8C4_9SPIO|nr:phosphatase [Thiospirochaeta perfilievii]QEN03290.1 phosphatase [Thiospirochaeta perfilievii]
MNLELDTHTHTVASGHAYSSLNEMALAASQKGLKIMATTDHGPAMPGGAHIYHFHNLRVIPKLISGVRILRGVEANIIDYTGRLDIPTDILSEMELVVASFHGPCIEPSTPIKTTEALINLMENKNVDIIGHPEDSRYRFDYVNVVKKAKESKTLLELNNSSLLPTTFRENSREGLIKILEICGNEGAKIVLGSDSHHTSSVGRFDMAIKLIDEIGFPKELVINQDSDEFLNYISRDIKW